MKTSPTLLIGLGGIGSVIVDSIYKMIPKENRENIAALAFDTNINDLEKLENLPKDNIFQTSSDKAVWQYVLDNEGIKDWFPYENKEIMEKTLSEGAGQVRAVSRLAFRAAIEEKRILKVDEFINDLFTAKGDKFTGNIKVVIICTIAGGTGAGSFLQTAYYLKDKLTHSYSRPGSKIVGVFLLPDILVKTGRIKDGQIQNVYSNAYACIKEFNAIINNRNSPGFADIELEYKPDMVDIDGHIDHRLPADLPYDYCYLFDFENFKNENLNYFENYQRQVINSLYIDLFTPIAANGFSIKDNTIRDLIREGGLNRYCGAGSALVKYPYEDITYYMSLRWTYDNIKDKCLKIDDDIKKEFSDYRKAILEGERRTEPNEGKIFRQRMDQYAKGASSDPFFKWVYESAWIKGEEGELIATKGNAFLKRFEIEMTERTEKDKELSNLNSNCSNLDSNQLTHFETAVDEIDDHERNLKKYKSAIIAYIDTNRNYFTNQAIFADISSPSYQSNIEYRFNTYILKKDEPIHPLAVRFILYEIHDTLQNKVNHLSTQNKDTFDFIERYPKMFDLPDSDETESAIDRLTLANEQNIIGRLFNNKLKDFISSYKSNTNIYLSKLNDYKVNYLKELVFNELLIQVNQMIETWRTFFLNLDDVNLTFKNELNNLAVQHDKEGDPATYYVLGKKEHKELLYSEMEKGSYETEFPSDLNEKFYNSLYLKSHQAYKLIENKYGDQEILKTADFIKLNIVKWYQTSKIEKIDFLNKNCVDAIHFEAKLLKKNTDEHLRDVINKIDELAQPYCPKPNKTGVSWINAWGIHPDCVDPKVISQNLVNDLFKDGKVENKGFSKYEIIREKVLYNLLIDDFLKFFHGDQHRPAGSYFIAYNEMIRRITSDPEREITPHLDKRWHHAAYMPDIHEKKADNDRLKIKEAFIYGLLLHTINIKKNRGKLSWQHQGNDGTRILYLPDGNECLPLIHALFKGLFYNGIIVDKVMSQTNQTLEGDKLIYSKKGNFRSTELYKKSVEPIYYGAKEADFTIIDLVLFYPHENLSDKNLEDEGVEILKGVISCIHDYYREIAGDSPATKTEANKLIKKMIEGSERYKKANKNDGYVSQCMNLLKNLPK
jgi:hypothetical protein